MKNGMVAVALLSASVLLPAGAGAEVVNPEVVKPQVVTPQAVNPPQVASPAPTPSAAPAAAPAGRPPTSGSPAPSAPPRATSQAPAPRSAPAQSAPRGQQAPQKASGQDAAPAAGGSGNSWQMPSGRWCVGSRRACGDVYDLERGYLYELSRIWRGLSDSLIDPIDNFLDQFSPDSSPLPDSGTEGSFTPEGDGGYSSADGAGATSAAEEDCQCSLGEEGEPGAGARLWWEDWAPVEEN